MRVLLSISLLLVLTSCQLQTQNSVSGDKDRFGGNGTDPLSNDISPEFKEVLETLQKRCTSCHASYAHFSENEWQRNGYVTPGSARTSLLYMRLRGAGAGGKENMPQDGPLTPDQLAAFYNWIQRMAPAHD